MREAKAPDLHAPRFRPKVTGTLNKKFIKELINENPELKGLSEEQIKKIITKFNILVRNKVIENRDGVDLPEQIGHIFIGSCKQMKSNVDFKKSAEYLQKIQHRNWESDERTAKIFYTTSGVFFTKERIKRYKFKHQELWGFVGCRKFTRTVSAKFPENFKKYIEVDPTKKIKFSYEKALKTNHIEKYNEEVLQTYNPFEE